MNMRNMMRNLIILSIIFVFSINISMAGDVNDTIQYLKIKQLSLDKNWNTYPVIVDLTVNKIGNLSYTETYYNEDSEGNPKYLTSSRYEKVLTNSSISFQIYRPRNKLDLQYSFIKTKIMIDNQIVFDEWIPLNQSYKYKNTNSISPNITRVPKSTNKVQPIKQGVDENQTDLSGENQKIPGFGIEMMIGIIGIIYMIKKIKT